MRSILLVFVLSLLFSGCSNDDNANSNCNFLLNVGVSFGINLNLPQYSQLQFVSNSVYIPAEGNGGLIVTNTGTGFVAYDAADPNHSPSQCSILEIQGAEGKCGCPDENRYSLFTGQPLGNPDLRCALKAYRVTVNGNDLLITN